MTKKKITWVINGKRKCVECGDVINILKESYALCDDGYLCVDCIEYEDIEDEEGD